MNEFRNVFESNCLNILNSSPTHFFQTGASLLDLFVTRDTSSVKRIDQIDTGMSLHAILVMSYRSPSRVTQNQQKMCRNLKSIDEEKLFIDTCLLPWEEILSLVDTDSIVAALVENLKYLLDKHAPLLPVRDRLKGSTPCFSGDIAIAIIGRDIY